MAEQAAEKPAPEITGIFVVGTGRSGTTLMRAMLSAHSAIAISGETHLLNHWLPHYAHLDVRRRDHFESFWQAFSTSDRFRNLYIDPDAAKARILAAGKHDYKAVFRGVMEEYACAMNKPLWGEKTPGHYQHLDTLVRWFPRARIICLLRDPRAVVASHLTVPWAHGDVDLHAAQWRDCVRILDKWVDDERVRIVKYEDLVTAPRQEMTEVCEFIGVRFEPAMVEAREEAYSTENRRGWAKAHLEFARMPVTADRIERWRSQLSRRRIAVIEEITRREMRENGYEPVTTGLSHAQASYWLAMRVSRPLRRLLHLPGRLLRNADSAR